MPSSISSSDRKLPNVQWMRVLGSALLVFISFIAFMEIRLAGLGYRPTILDSQEKWASERARASKLGDRALILVGASRIQLGVDMDVLRRETGLEPVQLAIDGSPFGPILNGLAEDPAIRGTVLVDYYDSAVRDDRSSAASTYQRNYEKRGIAQSPLRPNFMAEKMLTELLHENLRIYADGANPFFSLNYRILAQSHARQFLTTLPDRSRLADYQLVDMPSFYYQRVSRELGMELTPESGHAATKLAQEIALLRPLDNGNFIRQTKNVRRMVSAIKSRGGRVMFVGMPSSGMVREIEERRYPRAQFWDLFVGEVDTPALRSAYYPSLRDFSCPDGSHLDFRDRSRFTLALVRSLGLDRRAE